MPGVGFSAWPRARRGRAPAYDRRSVSRRRRTERRRGERVLELGAQRGRVLHAELLAETQAAQAGGRVDVDQHVGRAGESSIACRGLRSRRMRGLRDRRAGAAAGRASSRPGPAHRPGRWPRRSPAPWARTPRRSGRRCRSCRLPCDRRVRARARRCRRRARPRAPTAPCRTGAPRPSRRGRRA